MKDVENHLSEGVTRARLRLELRRSLLPLVWLLVGAALAVAGWSVITNNVSTGLATSKQTVRLAVDDATGVVAGRDDVRIKGIHVGKITKVELVDGKPVLTAQIRSEYGRVFRDARATLRPNTALLDMYLDFVDRGTPAAGPASASVIIPSRQTQTGVKIADVLQTFDPNVRGHLAALFDQMGQGLKHRGLALREAFVRIAPFLRVTARMTDQLAAQDHATRRLVTNFATLTGELGRRQRDLRDLAEKGGATFRTLQRGAGNLEQTLRELAPTLRSMGSSLTTVRGVLPDVDDAVHRLTPVAGQLPSALRAVSRFSDAADPALQALRRPVKRLVPLAKQLKPVAGNLESAMTRFAPQVSAFDHVARTLGGCMVPLYGFFQWTPSLLKLNDARGIYPRGEAVLSLGSTSLIKDPSQFDATGCAPGAPKGAQP